MLARIVGESIRMVISGRVQGVGFRHFMWRRATELGLSGDVRNLASGAVEVRARGEAAALDQLAALARQGPPAARVTEVRIDPEDADLASGFRVRD